MHDDDDDDDDWDEDGDSDTGDDDGYVPCPYCGETMLEDAEHCPSCNRWITSEDMPRKSLPTWMVVVIVLCLAGLILGALRGI